MGRKESIRVAAIFRSGRTTTPAGFDCKLHRHRVVDLLAFRWSTDKHNDRCEHVLVECGTDLFELIFSPNEPSGQFHLDGSYSDE